MILDTVIITTYIYLVVFALNVPPVKSTHLPPADTQLLCLITDTNSSLIMVILENGQEKACTLYSVSFK